MKDLSGFLGSTVGFVIVVTLWYYIIKAIRTWIKKQNRD